MKVLLLGYGKMGKAIEEVLLARGHAVRYAVNSIEDLETKNFKPEDVEVAIEFTAPAAAAKNIEFCLDNNIPVLSGTTGWLDAMAGVIDKTNACNGCFFYASNFSIGVNLFFQLNEELANKLNKYDYKPEIEEIHHTQKLDSPSGTAITLAEAIIERFYGLKRWINNQEGEKESISITSIREGEVPGTHKIVYRGANDTITITHQALNREGFANGAVDVAEWLKDKKGVLSMKDYLAS
jgi:4-hydroxy-tetrahydrodipicolinate reductase